ncbi:MAG: toll/interleukin-1 receptor domain-containing protein, partial [Sphingomonadaceae bacterium]
MGASVFISYQRGDTEYARYLAERLTEYGRKVWWDSAIQPGQDWRETIAEGLEQAPVFVVLHSAAAEKSPEV